MFGLHQQINDCQTKLPNKNNSESFELNQQVLMNIFSIGFQNLSS